MNLNHLSDQELHLSTQNAVRAEKEALHSVLNHLRENDQRRLYSDFKCASLFEYATRILAYTEDEACRRISAMRVLKALPQIEEKVQKGGVKLTHLIMAQSLFNREAKTEAFSVEKQLEVLERMENTSVREAEKIVLDYSTQQVSEVTEKVRLVSRDTFEVKFGISEETQSKVKKLKGLLAHSNPNLSLSELFEKLCDIGIEALDPAKAPIRKANLKKSPAATRTEPKRGLGHKQVREGVQNQTLGQASAKTQGQDQQRNRLQKPTQTRMPLDPQKYSSSYIPAQIKREVWKNAQGRCQNCRSHFALEIEHCYPKALGGSSGISNLRLLCRACNQRAAVKIFGVKKMSSFLNSKR